LLLHTDFQAQPNISGFSLSIIHFQRHFSVGLAELTKEIPRMAVIKSNKDHVKSNANQFERFG